MDRESAIAHFKTFGAKCLQYGTPDSPRINIQLEGSSAGDDDLDFLAPLEDHYIVLGLAGTRVTDIGMERVARCKRILDLDLTDTGITDKGLEKLYCLSNLELILLERTNVTLEGIAAFEAACPACRIGSWGDD